MPFELDTSRLPSQKGAKQKLGPRRELVPRQYRFEQGTDPTFWQRFSRSLWEDPEKGRARAANALAISESFGISPSDALEYHDEISKEVGLKGQPTTPELMGEVMKLPIVAGLMAHPVSTLIGLAGFQAIGEAESAIVSLVKDEKYQFMEHKGISKLLPDEADAHTKEVIDSAEFAALLLLGFKIGKASPKWREKILRDIIVEYKAPRTMYLSPQDVVAYANNNKMLPGEVNEIMRWFNLSRKEWLAAAERGMHLELPTERIATIVDRPWWGKVKEILKLDPTQKTRHEFGGEPAYKIGKAAPAHVPEMKLVPSHAPGAEPPVTEAAIEPSRPPEVPKRIRSEALDQDKWFPIPEERIPIERIDEYSELAGEATRQAIEKIQKEWAKEDKAIRREAEKEAAILTEEDPQYRIFREIIDRGRINQQSLRDMGITSEDIAAVRGVRPGLIAQKGKLHADKLAQEYGYDSVDAMVQDWKYRKPKKTMITELAEQLADEQLITADVVRDMIFNERVVDEEIAILNKMLGRKKHKMKKAKKIIREKTGQIKASKILEKGEVFEIQSATEKIDPKTGKPKVRKAKFKGTLKDLIRLEAKAARDAFRAGKREAALKHKEKQRELLQRKREREQLRRRVLQLAKEIKKKPAKTVEFAYADVIRQIQERIDLKFRSKRTLEQRETMRQLIKQLPEEVRADIPVTLMRKINARSLNDYTVNELELIAAEIKRLRDTGRKVRATKLKTRKLYEANVAKQIEKGLLKGKPPKIEPPYVGQRLGKPAPARLYSKLRAYTLNPQRLFDMIDGRKGFDGPAFNKFYREVNVIESNKLRAIDKRLDAGTAKLKELGLKAGHLAKKTKLDWLRDPNTGQKLKMSRDAMIDIYNKEKNPLSKLALMYGNRLSEATINKIIAQLTPAEKALGDFIRKDFADNYMRVRQAHIEFTNTDMGFEIEYTPMFRLERPYTTMEKAIQDDLLRRHAFKKGMTETGFTQERLKNIPPEYQKRIKLGAFESWSESVALQEHYMHFAIKARELHRIAEQRNLRRAIRDKLGDAYNKAVKSYIDHVADPEYYRSYQWPEEWVRRARQNIALAYLSGNLVTMGKQLPSVFLYMQDSGPYWLLRSAAEIARHPRRIPKMINELDPQVKHRSIERELEELKLANKTAYDRLVRKYGKAGLVGIKMMDRVAVDIGWYSVYLKNLRKHGQARAVELASEATLRTQPTARAKDLPHAYRTNEFANVALQFTRQLNQIYNMWTYDLPSDIRHKEISRSIYQMGGLAISALMIWSVVNKRLPETPEDGLDAMQDQWLGMLPWVGKHLQAQFSGWHAQETPMWVATEGVSSILTKEGEARLKRMFEAFSLLSGFPYTGTTRGIEAIIERDVKELFGKPPRGQSKTKLKKRKLKKR